MSKAYWKMVAGLSILPLLFLTIPGCTQPVSETSTQEGRLARVEYAFHSGMVWGADFSIDVNEEEIVSAAYFSSSANDMQTKENCAITPEQWKAIEDAVLAVKPVLKEYVPQKPAFLKRVSNAIFGTDYAPIDIQDGGDTFSFHLTWEQDGQQTRVEYYDPNDRRFTTLRSILEETADPIGREIQYYEAPVLDGFYVSMDSSNPLKSFSYQCTLKDREEGNGERYFFSNFPENGVQSSYSTTVYGDVWERILQNVMDLGIESLPDGSHKKAPQCTLYYSDGSQRTVNPDQKTSKEMELFFGELVNELREAE